MSPFKGASSTPPAPWQSDKKKCFVSWSARMSLCHEQKQVECSRLVVQRCWTAGRRLQFAASELPVGPRWQSACRLWCICRIYHIGHVYSYLCLWAAYGLCTVTLLLSPYGTGQTIIFLHYAFFLSSFFPRLISAVADWMSAILPHMVWP